jgi:hypothetical protein
MLLSYKKVTHPELQAFNTYDYGNKKNGAVGGIA